MKRRTLTGSNPYREHHPFGTVGDAVMSCKTDADCPKGRYCTAFGTCIAGPCSLNSDCDPDYACWGGLCVSKANLPSGSECVVNTDCPAETMCGNGYCIKKAGGVMDPQKLCQQFGGTWDPVNKKCIPGAPPSVTPACTDDPVVRKVQKAMGLKGDGTWGCSSQAALNSSAMSYQEMCRGCTGPLPSPRCQNCQKGKCIKSTASGLVPVGFECSDDGSGCAADDDCCNGSCSNSVCQPSAAPQESTGLMFALIALGATAAGLGAWALTSKLTAKPAANPTESDLERTAVVDTYRLVTPEGHHIRMATRVRFSDGFIVEFIDKMSKRSAIEQALWHRERERLGKK